MAWSFFIKNKQTILDGIALAAALFLLKWLELRFLVLGHAFEAYIGAIAVLFTTLGIWLALKLAKPKIQTSIIEKRIYINNTDGFAINQRELDKLNLSRRELAVLQLMAEGLSNNEISDRLVVSLNTIKTHTSNLCEKMEVTRRTQAVELAKRLSIIP